jgi:hypothetical protein
MAGAYVLLNGEVALTMVLGNSFDDDDGEDSLALTSICRERTWKSGERAHGGRIGAQYRHPQPDA